MEGGERLKGKVKAPSIFYDPKIDSLYVYFSSGRQEGFVEIAPNVHLEVGEGGRIVGMEILSASKLFQGDPIGKLVRLGTKVGK